MEKAGLFPALVKRCSSFARITKTIHPYPVALSDFVQTKSSPSFLYSTARLTMQEFDHILTATAH
jgi:hypothetical protein